MIPWSAGVEKRYSMTLLSDKNFDYQREKRLVIKSLLYIAITFVSTTLLFNCLFSNAVITTKSRIIIIIIVAKIIELCLYFIYESVWNKITWGLIAGEENNMISRRYIN